LRASANPAIRSARASRLLWSALKLFCWPTGMSLYVCVCVCGVC
jgi:hypothetical protein